MEFHGKWINWLLETADEETIGRIGHRCYQDSEWVKKLPVYSGENDVQQMIAFLKDTLPDFIYHATEKGFIVDLNERKCFCPLVESLLTKNPNLCQCTKSFDKSMYE